MVPIAAVEELAATRGAGRRRVSEDIDLPSPAQAVTDSQGGEAPRWAMELLSRADARTEHLLERLAQAERERASAERDAAIEKHRRERAETDAEDLRAELESLRGSDDAGSTDAMPERADTGAVGAAQPRRWWDRLRRTE